MSLFIFSCKNKENLLTSSFTQSSYSYWSIPSSQNSISLPDIADTVVLNTQHCIELKLLVSPNSNISHVHACQPRPPKRTNVWDALVRVSTLVGLSQTKDYGTVMSLDRKWRFVRALTKFCGRFDLDYTTRLWNQPFVHKCHEIRLQYINKNLKTTLQFCSVKELFK